ncbi:MAG: hypothetical protein KatS3mg035_1094 [Bacteroidia bacterium]|nr:MAG: hypothetical protein KatS3mg035_1094 [Bacteroidia bacterium]
MVHIGQILNGVKKEWLKWSLKDRKCIPHLSDEEKKQIFSRLGETNGMFGKGWKLTGATNGRFLTDKKREFNKEELLEAFKKTDSIDQGL